MICITKTERIDIRITRQQKRTIKELNLTFAEVFDKGYYEVAREHEEALNKKLDFHKKKAELYERLKLEHQRKKENEYDELDNLYDTWWILQEGRTITNYTDQDVEALNLQLEKRGLTNYSVKYVLRYWREKEGK